MANGIWSSEPEAIRGGGKARSFHLKTAKGYWNGKVYAGPLTHGRAYSKDELWDNYTYFIRQIAPVAEEAGVRIGIHPDDPPVPEVRRHTSPYLWHVRRVCESSGNSELAEYRCLSVLRNMDGRWSGHGQECL